jgi:uncharacterized protein with HXXEE motif
MSQATIQQRNKTISLLSWLFPITYVIHIAEEYWLGEGYPAYILRLRGVHLSPARFWIAQSIGTILMIAGVIVARKLKFERVMLVILATTALVNGLTHATTNAISGAYGPGLYSSILLWIPLGLASLLYVKSSVIRWKYWMAVAIGIAINGAVAIITMRGGRLV